MILSLSVRKNKQTNIEELCYYRSIIFKLNYRGKECGFL